MTATKIKINADSKPNSSHIVIDSTTKRVLSGDNINQRLPMASTTKIMTALVAIESGKLDKKVVIDDEMARVEGSSIYLKVGEELTIRELLYGLMLRSGNDSAIAIAKGTYGNVENFVNAMNNKAKNLNLNNTHFKNPHGLHDKEHYTSSYDLAIISAAAMSNQTFREIVSSKSKIIGGETSEKRYLVNKNKMLRMYEGSNGIKTGFTKNAGRCLVSSAKRGDFEVISVVLNEPNMWEYSMKSMDNVFENYRNITIAKKHQIFTKRTINGKIYNLCIHKTLTYPIRDLERNKLDYDILLNDIKKDVKIGENVGKLQVYYDKHLIFEEKIYTM